ncbi:MAG: RnfABCDGE type electron transport complex subunit D, partial [Lentisphaeria bacterium]|nr:RnfABCDGE type electron transport complex subunit D [Lentisphaeria bacterium]
MTTVRTNEAEMAENEIQLPDTSKLVISGSPHLHAKGDVRRIMLIVILALLPACAVGVYFFGLRALLVLAVCGASSVAFEHLATRMMGRESAIGDNSALLTGLLLGMNLSAGTPIWVCIVGSLLAIGLGKMIYGGLGYNPFNPALVGRVGLLIACPVALTTWVKPGGPGQWAANNVDSMTGPTPLGVLGEAKSWEGVQNLVAQGQFDLSYTDWFLGRMGGCIGETCAVALLVGGIVLIALRIIRWHVPVTFIATVFLISGAAHLISPTQFAPPMYHMATGGLFLGAFFMA